MINIDNQITSKVRISPGYKPVKQISDLTQKMQLNPDLVCKVDGSENLFLSEARSLSMVLNTYPDPNGELLCQALSKYTQVNPDQILIGNGSDELIDLLCAVFLDPGDVLVDCPPTFPLYQYFAKVRNVAIQTVPRLDDFQLDLAKTVKVLNQSKLLFLANPNNPTGTLIDQPQIESLLSTGKPVIIDEAYYEYSGFTVAPLLKKYPNLIILRTFSKWAGLAGVRVGYMLANQSVVEAVKSIKPPYNVNSIAQLLATEALNDPNIQKNLQTQLEIRVWFFGQLRNIDRVVVYPTQANFFFVEYQGLNSAQLCQAMENKGLIVRPYQNEWLNGVRIGIAPKLIMKRIIKCLEEIA